VDETQRGSADTKHIFLILVVVLLLLSVPYDKNIRVLVTCDRFVLPFIAFFFHLMICYPQIV
jgi:hypothetical protein